MLGRPIGRLAIVFSLACTSLAIAASAASAATASASLTGCASVTFSYHDFGAGQSVTAMETVTVNGTTVVSKTVHFTQATSGATTTDTVAVPSPANGKTVVAKTTYTVSPDGSSGSVTSPLGIITACPVTYTGKAYNLGASASLAGITVLSPLTINQVGPVATTSAVSPSSTILNESLPALGLTGAQLVSSVTTGGDVSTAATSVNSLSVLGLPLGAPAITNGVISSTSTTKCDVATATLSPSPSGTTNIASLTIGTTDVVGTGPGALVPAGPIAPNTVVSLGPLGSVILNEQIPITDGLEVNAVDVKLSPLMLASVNVISGQSDSDIEGC
jgi:hypothetical protein